MTLRLIPYDAYAFGEYSYRIGSIDLGLAPIDDPRTIAFPEEAGRIRDAVLTSADAAGLNFSDPLSLFTWTSNWYNRYGAFTSEQFQASLYSIAEIQYKRDGVWHPQTSAYSIRQLHKVGVGLLSTLSDGLSAISIPADAGTVFLYHAHRPLGPVATEGSCFRYKLTRRDTGAVEYSEVLYHNHKFSLRPRNIGAEIVGSPSLVGDTFKIRAWCDEVLTRVMDNDNSNTWGNCSGFTDAGLGSEGRRGRVGGDWDYTPGGSPLTWLEFRQAGGAWNYVTVSSSPVRLVADGHWFANGLGSAEDIVTVGAGVRRVRATSVNLALSGPATDLEIRACFRPGHSNYNLSIDYSDPIQIGTVTTIPSITLEAPTPVSGAVVTAGESVVVRAVVDDPDGNLKDVKLYYRAAGSPSWESVDMTKVD